MGLSSVSQPLCRCCSNGPHLISFIKITLFVKSRSYEVFVLLIVPRKEFAMEPPPWTLLLVNTVHRAVPSLYPQICSTYYVLIHIFSLYLTCNAYCTLYYNRLSSFLSRKVSAALGFFQQISASESSSSTGKELSDAECKQAGFNRLATNSVFVGRRINSSLFRAELLCSSCDILGNFELRHLADSCRGCCRGESAKLQGQVKYPKAVLEVCG